MTPELTNPSYNDTVHNQTLTLVLSPDVHNALVNLALNASRIVDRALDRLPDVAAKVCGGVFFCFYFLLSFYNTECTRTGGVAADRKCAHELPGACGRTFPRIRMARHRRLRRYATHDPAAFRVYVQMRARGAGKQIPPEGRRTGPARRGILARHRNKGFMSRYVNLQK